MLPPHRQMFYQLCDLEVERYSVVLWGQIIINYYNENGPFLDILLYLGVMELCVCL